MKGLRQPANLLTENSCPPIPTRCTVYGASTCEMWRHHLMIILPNQKASLIFAPTRVSSICCFQASKAPDAFARQTEDSGRRTHERYRGVCSAPVDPGGEVRGCSVGRILGMPETSPLVFTVATRRYMGFLELKKCFAKRGCFGYGGTFWCSDWHEIVILFPLH